MVRGHDPRKNERPPDWRILALAAAHSYEEAAHKLEVDLGTFMRWLAEADPDSRPRVPEADLRATPTSALLRELRRRGEGITPELTEEDHWQALEEIHDSLLTAARSRAEAPHVHRAREALEIPDVYSPEALRAWRLARGWSQREMAEAIGSQGPYISELERDIFRPRTQRRVMLSLLIADEIEPERMADRRDEDVATLEALREATGLSRRGLARVLGLAGSTVQCWFARGRVPGTESSAELIRWFAEVYGLPVSPIDPEEDP